MTDNTQAAHSKDVNIDRRLKPINLPNVALIGFSFR